MQQSKFKTHTSLLKKKEIQIAHMGFGFSKLNKSFMKNFFTTFGFWGTSFMCLFIYLFWVFSKKKKKQKKRKERILEQKPRNM